MIFQHHRFQIWNSLQHPYKHNLGEMGYINPALPGGAVFNAQQALDWVFAVLYPNTKPAVATVGDLPLVGNVLNDYRVVSDDGDGKAAAYRWEQREGEVAPSWHKIYDMDWGEQSILSNFLTKTQDVYVLRYGHDDIDPDGNPPPAEDAGQHIYGGASAGTHLHLHANAGDGTGPQTGFITVHDSVRPYPGSLTVDLGTVLESFRSAYFSTSVVIGNFLIAADAITNSSGAISFGDENLSTTGTILAGSTLLLGSGSITDTTGLIDFADEDLGTSGFVTASHFVGLTAPSQLFSGTTVGTLVFSNASITDPSGAISFGDENLTTTGTSTAADMFSGYRFTVPGIIHVGDNGLGAAQVVGFGPLLLSSSANIVNVQANLYVDLGMVVSGVSNLQGGAYSENGNGYTSYAPLAAYSTTLHPAGITSALTVMTLLAPLGVEVNADLRPSTNGDRNLGSSLLRWDSLFLSGSISNGTDSILSSTLLSFRDSTGTADGQTLFWDNTLQKWVASLPDSEIDHGTISGLLDDDHTQYALLAGRAGGQTLWGSNTTAEHLVLGSNSVDPTNGNILVRSDVVPFTDNARSLGNLTNAFLHIYMKGEAKGLRVESFNNFGLFPAASGLTIGRLAYDISDKDLYFDIGGSWKRASVDTSYNVDSVNWDGVIVSYTYDVSADCTNARRMVWSFQDVANDYEQMIGASIKFPTPTTVQVSFDFAPPAGTYVLVGVGL